MNKKLIKISDFSELTGLSIKALRLYEAHGILIPMRSASNCYRLYNELQVELAKEILVLRTIGFSIREIKALLPFRTQAEEGFLTILRAQLHKTEQTLIKMKQQRNQIKMMIRQAQFRNNLEVSDKYFSKRLICNQVSDSIKRLTNEELLEKIKSISNAEYILTFAMIDDLAKEKLLSVVSEKAKNLVKRDLKVFDQKYAHLWNSF